MIEFHGGGVEGHGLGLGLRDGEAGEGGLAEVKVKVEGGVRRGDGVMEGEGAEGGAQVVGGGGEEAAEVRRAANYGSRRGVRVGH